MFDEELNSFLIKFQEVTEEVINDNEEDNGKHKDNAEEASTKTDAIQASFDCEICDFKSNRVTGLRIHMTKKHALIEQIDGNTTLPVDEDKADEELEYFLQTGYLKNPEVKAENGQDLWLYIKHQIRKCKLSNKDQEEEFRILRANNDY